MSLDPKVKKLDRIQNTLIVKKKIVNLTIKVKLFFIDRYLKVKIHKWIKDKIFTNTIDIARIYVKFLSNNKKNNLIKKIGKR